MSPGAHQIANPEAISVEVDQESQKKTVTVPPEALTIIWGGTDSKGRYWKMTDQVAELVGASWLEVKGSVPLDKFTPNTEYQLCFKLKFNGNESGWDGCPPVIFNARLANEKPFTTRLELGKYLSTEWKDAPEALVFIVKETNPKANLTFIMFEIGSDDLKKGLMIKEVKITPTKVQHGNAPVTPPS